MYKTNKLLNYQANGLVLLGLLVVVRQSVCPMVWCVAIQHA